MRWKISPSYPDYKVSEDGRVMRITAAPGAHVGRILKPWRRDDGYAMYIIRHDGRSIHKKAHQLVAEAFLGPKPFPAAEVCHNDGDPSNDHYKNLRWDTRASNHQDKVAHGTDNRGSKHPQSRFTDEQILEIFRLASTREKTQREIADQFDMQQAHVSRILLGKRWAHLTGAGG